MVSGISVGSMDVYDSANQPTLKPWLILTGTAEDSVGPPIGVAGIGISEDAFLFRVALPGIRRNECKVKCDVRRDGTFHIKGEVRYDVGILKDRSSVFQMRVQQLNPPGPFAITFKLPGPVDPRFFSPNFRDDGILEAVVMKYRGPKLAADGIPLSSTL